VRVRSGTEDIMVPELERIPYPHLPREVMRRYLNPGHWFIDSSRGCPFICSFCTVKNLFGRTMRSRDPAALTAWMAEKVDRDGARFFGFFDDNFVRNPRHLEVLEGIAKIRAEGRKFHINVMLDVESCAYTKEDSPRGERNRRFMALCRDAGVASVFIGLESTNDSALVEMNKQVNREHQKSVEGARRALIERYRSAVDAWHEIGAWVDCGYILGWDADAPGCGVRGAADTIEIGIDLVNFYLIAPLPGAEDYARAKANGLLLLSDFNEYFQRSAMVAHPRMSPADLEREHGDAVERFFSWPNVLRRVLAGVLGIGRAPVVAPWLYTKRQLGFKVMMMTGLYTYYEGGLLRRRGARFHARREVVSDEEARRHYLGAEAPRAALLPAELGEDGSMESLPILRRHALGAVIWAR
jgi:radical SAM superfamily enzyme YgiQ (UPF0313 family)